MFMVSDFLEHERRKKMKKYEFTLKDSDFECVAVEYAYTMIEAVAKLAYTFDADLIVSVKVSA
jgi:hypothetical protein